ncbi:MAG: sensor histidine kinase, partial [Hyphomicrobiaceae bacterium]
LGNIKWWEFGAGIGWGLGDIFSVEKGRVMIHCGLGRLQKIVSGVGLTRMSLMVAALTAVALSVGIAAIAYMMHAANEHQVAARNRWEAYLLADQLRQSSDDLTRMARSYVATGNPAYRQRYEQIIRIRDGLVARPANYERPFWDIIEPGLSYTGEAGARISLRRLFEEVELTDKEIQALDLAKRKSDDQVVLERRAMDIVAAIGTSQVDEEFGIYKQKHAMDLLYSPEYHRQKKSVMEPINRFFSLQADAFAKRISELDTGYVRGRRVSVASAIGMLISLALGIWFMSQFVVGPMTRIARVLDSICAGNLDQPIPYLDWKNEIGIVARSADTFRKNAALHQRAVDMDFFVKVAAHDLRAPVANALLVLDLLEKHEKRRGEDRKAGQYMEKMRTTLQNMLMLLAKLRNLTQVGSRELSVGDIRLAELLQEIQDENAEMAADAVELEIKGDTTISGSRELLRNMFVNFLTNAARYGTDPKKVHVEISQMANEKSVVLWNETSHRYDDADQLLAPFKRGISAQDGGSGLGLAICKRIVELHHGKIRIDVSEPGIFRLMLKFKEGVA